MLNFNGIYDYETNKEYNFHLHTGRNDRRLYRNPLAATEVTPSLLLTKMEEYGFNCRSWEYQVGNNLYTNDYAQYVSNTATYFATANYEWKDNWANDGFWKSYYTYLAKPLNETKAMLDRHPEYSNIYQMMRIISAMGPRVRPICSEMCLISTQQQAKSPRDMIRKRTSITIYLRN